MIQFGVINYIFGSPGSGKSTVLAMISRKYIKRGFKVYANFPLQDTILIKDEDIGYYNFYNSIIILDEAGISYNNREAFSKKGLMQDQNRISYWKLARHYLEHDNGPKGKIFIASQSWDDVDKKLRDLSTNYYLIKKGIIRSFTVIRPIYKKVDIDDQTHQPGDFFVMDIFWNWKLCFRRLYYKYFDSTECPELPDFVNKSPGAASAPRGSKIKNKTGSKNQDENLQVYHLSKILNFDNKDSDHESLSD